MGLTRKERKLDEEMDRIMDDVTEFCVSTNSQKIDRKSDADTGRDCEFARR